MKLLFPSLALLLLSARGEDVAPLFEPEEGTVLKRVFDAQAEYGLEGITYAINGEEIEPPEDMELPEFKISFREHIAVTDELESMGDGRPQVLLRTFDELSQDDDQTQGEETATSHSSSDLEGRKLRFTWNADDEAYDVAAADEGELDSGMTAWLREDMDLRAVLPNREVAVGDEWSLPAELYLCFMWPGGLLDFHGEDEEVDEDGREVNGQTIDGLTGSGTARLEEVREEDGQRLAVFHVELTIQTGIDQEGDGQFGPMQVHVGMERTLTGTILWDLEHGHAHSAELEAEATRTTTRTQSASDEEGQEFELVETETLAGTITYSTMIERQ